jgi:hypothetical protein
MTNPIREYGRKPTNRNLIWIADTAGPWHGDALLIRNLLEACTPRKPCQTYGCANCSDKIGARALNTALDALVLKCGGVTPEPKACSWVTINGPTCVLADPDEVERAEARFRRKLASVQKKNFPDTSWTGWMDLSVNGLLHTHVVILHADRSREELVEILRRCFLGQNRVHAEPWHADKRIDLNIENVMDYTLVGDRHVPRHRFGPERGRPNLDLHTAADIMNRMVCLRRLRGRGLQGLRISLNMRSPYKWREGEIVDRVTGQRLFIEWTANRFQPRRQKKRTTRSDRKWNRANRPALTLAEKHAVRVADVLNRGVRPYQLGLPAEIENDHRAPRLRDHENPVTNRPTDGVLLNPALVQVKPIGPQTG